MGSPTEVTYNDNEKHLGQTADVDEKDATNVNVLPAGSSESSVVEGAELGHVPQSRKFNIKRFFRSLVTKQAWFGDYDYGSLFVPNIPFLCKASPLPFYGIDDNLPYLLLIILGLQHAFAMLGGVVVPPLLLSGAAGANMGDDVTQYLVSAGLIYSGFGTVFQISRRRIFKTRYWIGTGLISVTGTAFTFCNVSLKYLNQCYDNGACKRAPDGSKLPCPDEFGALLGTGALTGIYAIALAFVPPRILKKCFTPIVIGTMITFIGASLVTSGVNNWAGGAGLCSTNHDLLCESGTQPHKWGSAYYLGLGFSCMAAIVICEVFGSAFMKSSSVFIGFLVGMIIAAACGYFNTEVIKKAPGATFLFVHTFKLSIRGQLVLPMMAAWSVIVAESVGTITASGQCSDLDIASPEFMTRVQGGMLADAISGTLANLFTSPPLTTFPQNAAVIALTRNASRQSGYCCAFILFMMGVISKIGAIFVAAPPAVIGGFTTFLFGSVSVSGVRIMAFAEWTRRERFIATAAFALGLASLVNKTWFSYIFTYDGPNTGLKGFLQAITLVVQEPYLIAAVVAVFLNLVLPHEPVDPNALPEAH